MDDSGRLLRTVAFSLAGRDVKQARPKAGIGAMGAGR
jgi:hypothetical protein